MRTKLLIEKEKVHIILPNMCNYGMKDGVVRTLIQKKRDKLYTIWLDCKFVGSAFMNSKRELVSLVDMGGYYAL